MKDRAEPGSRRAKSFALGQRLLDERGGPILIVCRYIPGARTAVTLSAGAVAYNLRKFSFFDGRGGGVNDAIDQNWGPALDGRPLAQSSYSDAGRGDVDAQQRRSYLRPR